MNSIAEVFALTAVAASLAALYLATRIRFMLSAWNVQQAWNWMCVAVLSLLMHAIVSIPQLNCSNAVKSAAAYFAATMLLTPLVTTLGARRPGISAWHWFVVLPMVMVLQWPAISQLSGNHWRTPIELSAPSMMGIVVVLIMSAGTYLGTLSTVFALLYSAGIVTLLLSVTSLNEVKPYIPALSSVLIMIALLMTFRNLRHGLQQIPSSQTIAQRTQAVWNLFSGLHGFAWTRRVQDRINQFAPRERWNVQLTSLGFQHSSDASSRNQSGDKRPDIEPTDEELAQPLHAFIWVLARFADESWLRQILQTPEKPKSPHNASDSFN